MPLVFRLFYTKFNILFMLKTWFVYRGSLFLVWLWKMYTKHLSLVPPYRIYIIPIQYIVLVCIYNTHRIIFNCIHTSFGPKFKIKKKYSIFRLEWYNIEYSTWTIIPKFKICIHVLTQIFLHSKIPSLSLDFH